MVTAAWLRDRFEFALMTPPTHTDPSATRHGIAFVHRGHDWIRGSEQCLLDLVAHLDRRRFVPLVVCEQPSLANAAAALDGVTVVQLDPADDWMLGSTRARRAALRAQLRELFRAHDVRLVHVNVTPIVPIILPVARQLRIPLVCHLHLSLANEYNRMYELVHQADMAVGVARHVLEPLQQDGVAAARLRVIYNGVAADRLGQGDASGLREALAIPASAMVVASVGSLIHRKAHDITLRAIAEVRRRGIDVRLVLCGDGEDAATLGALSDSLGVAPYVHFLGFRTDVGAVVRAVGDVFVTSAREEMMPLNVLEAEYLGVPVIASDIPAHREALEPGVSGLLVPAENPVALADAIAGLAAAPSRRAALATAGPGIVAERFSMARYVAAFEALYSELIARPRASFGWVRGTHWTRLYTEYAARLVKRRLGLSPRAVRSTLVESQT